jgi:glycosyltransferase involved in cell wall biosynthesis
VRYDIFQEHFQKFDNKGNSLNSGFWVIIPFAKIDSKSQVTLAIRAKLRGGEICESSIGTLTLEPTINKDKCCYNIDGESFEKPVIAICMATYNPSIEYFRKQIDSILHQTYTNWVCIINDDCSKPKIFEKIKDIIAVDIRFKIFRNSSNLGFYHNFERCLTYVPKDVSFVALSDQDDYWHEDKLSVLLNHFDDETLLVYSDMNIVNENGELIHSTYWTTRKNNFTELDLLIVANTVTGAASIFRRELLEFLLPFPERIGDSYHDNFIACTALSLGNIKYVDYPLYDYRQHSGSVYGHKVPSRGIKKENLISLLKKITKNKIIGNSLKNFRQNLLNYRTVYYNDYIRRVLLAHVLNLRCNGLPEKKRKIINRFVSLEKGLYGIIFEVAKNKFLRKGLITIGSDSQLLISVLSTKIINMYNRFKHYFLK